MRLLFYLFIRGIVSAVFSIMKFFHRKSAKHQKILEDFKQSITPMLAPGETLNSVCGYNPCVGVSSQRIFLGTKKGVFIFSYDDIEIAIGKDGANHETLNLERMMFVNLKLKDGRTYAFGNHSDGFMGVIANIDNECGFRLRPRRLI